jgi:hypothetical protein
MVAISAALLVPEREAARRRGRRYREHRALHDATGFGWAWRRTTIVTLPSSASEEKCLKLSV